MSAYTEAQLIGHVSTALNDAGTAIWGTATVAAQLQQDIRLISEYTPQLAKATVAFAGTARELSLSTVSDWLEIEAVEFPVDEHPRRYVNFAVRGGSVILDSYLPSVSTSDTAFIWYSAPHTVSGTATNTLNRWQENILIELAVSHLLQNIALDKREEINKGGQTVDTKYREDGLVREQKVMSRLIGHMDKNFAVRYPDVK